jgi:hypothetical protein
MPTYRVSIRRPTTNPPIWDWAETIVRPDPQTAINDSYQHWVDSGPNPAPQPLANCVAQAIPKNSVEKKS